VIDGLGTPLGLLDAVLHFLHVQRPQPLVILALREKLLLSGRVSVWQAALALERRRRVPFQLNLV
jgi:hypothetical protein